MKKIITQHIIEKQEFQGINIKQFLLETYNEFNKVDWNRLNNIGYGEIVDNCKNDLDNIQLLYNKLNKLGLSKLKNNILNIYANLLLLNYNCKFYQRFFGDEFIEWKKNKHEGELKLQIDFINKLKEETKQERNKIMEKYYSVLNI